MADVKYN